MVQRLKRVTAMWETWVRSLGREDPLEKEMATHSSTLAWRIPWMEKLGGLQSTGRKESDMTERLHFAFPFSRRSSHPGIEPRSPTLQADSLPAEPQGKPKNTGVGSLSLLQQIFLIQELNRGLLHCRQILYQLSYQGRPRRRER